MNAEVPIFQTHPIPKIEVLSQDESLMVSEALWVRLLFIAMYVYCSCTLRVKEKKDFPTLVFLYNWYQIIANGILGVLLLWVPGCSWLDSCPQHWDWIATLLFLHELTKYVDWIDTVWIIFKQDYRRLSFLHIYHHATIPLCWWAAVRWHATVGWYGAAFNSWVHVIMYAYYAGYFRALKVWVTRIQLIQFCFALFQSVWVYSFTNEGPIALLQTVYQISMLALFLPFYFQTYSEPADSGRRATKKVD
eukprot:TRINITY_DN852_c0_g1_i2.p1 TRINITY_DN852_c0_g1~~TRINITY_DN852_c0_g1_i2.p1  ORF type:complete len:248 (+),score=34.29 TRINITY_DN852_c0_g1_i2:105-848(+)